MENVSCKRIPRSPPRPVPKEMACGDKRLHVPLDRVATRPGDLSGVGDAHAPPIAGDIENPDREFREVAEDEPFAVDPLLEAVLLSAQRREKVGELGFPIGCVASERALGLPQGEVVGLLVLLDDALQGTIRHVRIARTQEQQGGENPGQATVAVLERMYGKERRDEDSND